MTRWSEIKERKGGQGILALLWIYRCLGKTGFKILLFPVIVFYWMTGYQQRRFSQAYLKRLKAFAQKQNVELSGQLTSFHHFISFANMILNKLLSWSGQVKVDDLNFPELQAYLDEDRLDTGSIVLCSHMGNIEVCRALAQLELGKTVNALVFTEHARKFHEIIKMINPEMDVNLIEVTTITPDVAIVLKQKLEAGEWLAIMIDRIPVSNYYRNDETPFIWSSFLGEKAPFPRGPFVLAAVLRCPLYSMVALWEEGRYTVHFEQLETISVQQRAMREQAIQQCVDEYARKLEQYCLLRPLEWFNFYDFWKKPENLHINKMNNEGCNEK